MKLHHMTSDGPKTCVAKPGKCRYDEHYDNPDEAWTVFESRQPAFNVLSSRYSKDFGIKQATVFQKSMARGAYMGCEVSSSLVKPYLDELRYMSGDEKFQALSASKAARDRGYHYHVTTISPPEMRKIGVVSTSVDAYDLKFKGIGKVNDGVNEAWFIVCESEGLDEYRTELGLPKKDFHVTLGFLNKDVHSMSKGLETLVVTGI